MNHSDNIDKSEVAKFDAMAANWWDPHGPCAPLHILNPTRLCFIQRHTKLENKNILDIGCGGGILSESLAKHGANVTALDASAEAINLAKEHAVSQNLTINYQHATIESFQTDTQFDIITCMELIEHVPDPAKLIADCARLLAPGGAMFISTLNRTLKAYALAIIGAEYVLNILPKHTHDYKKFIKPAELEQMLRAQKLSLVKLQGLKFDPFNKTASLYDSVDVNYLAYTVKEA